MDAEARRVYRIAIDQAEAQVNALLREVVRDMASENPEMILAESGRRLQALWPRLRPPAAGRSLDDDQGVRTARTRLRLGGERHHPRATRHGGVEVVLATFEPV
jgi:hypothetical protein